MNIVVALNQKFFYCAYMMFFSLMEHHPKGSVCIYVLHKKLTADMLASFEDLVEKYGNIVTEVRIADDMFPSDFPITDWWSEEIYFRLAILDVLPKDADRALYLDTDIIINGDLTSFYHTDFEGNDFVACEDWISHREDNLVRGGLFKEYFDAGIPYFNSGVMLWNLEGMRGTYSLSYYVEAIQKYRECLVAPDQDLLNYLHVHKVKYVPKEIYNLFARVANAEGMDADKILSESLIIHYAAEKPWSSNNLHFRVELLWWEYAKKSPFFEELAYDFISRTMTDPFVFDYVQGLERENGELQKNLAESLSVNQKLIGIVQSLQ